MIDAFSLEWLFTQRVPLIWFLIAAFTRPALWSKKARSLLKKKLDSDNKDER